MLQYLYTLEYSPRLVASSNAKPLTNGVNGHHHKDDATPSPKSAATTINGGSVPAVGATNGNQQQQQQQQLPLQQKPQPATTPATTLEYNIERETFESIPAGEAAAKLSKKAAKKKKRGSTDTTATAVPEPQASATTTAPANATANAAAQTVPPAAINNNIAKSAAAAVLPPVGPAVAQPPPQPQAKPTPPQHSLLQHAKLYTLAHKYAVPGLRALSAARFAAEAEEHWSSDDFLAAAVEAYNNTAPKPIPATATPKQASGVAAVNSSIATKSNINHTEESVTEEEEDDDRLQQKSIRDVVLSNMKAHPELLDRAAVREVMKINAELSFDLMMHFRDNQQNGGSASSVVSMQSGGRYY